MALAADLPVLQQVYSGAMRKAAFPLIERQPTIIAATLLAVMLCGLGGCVASKYKLAKKSTPPVQLLNVAFPASAPLQPTLAALITYGGPGSWKREALWDEYVVTLENNGKGPLSLDSAPLADSAGITFPPGDNPRVLEKQSKKLEKQYRASGEAFMRSAGPGVGIVGVGAAVAAASAGSGYAFVSPAVAGAAAAAIIILPVYYLSVWGINHHNKKAVMDEFARRRLPLPLTLLPGETRTGSLFYPMLRSPRSLELHWSGESGVGQAVLALEFLKDLHVPVAAGDIAPRKPATP